MNESPEWRLSSKDLETMCNLICKVQNSGPCITAAMAIALLEHSYSYYMAAVEELQQKMNELSWKN